MTVSEIMADKLSQVLNLDHVGESISLVSRTGAEPLTGRASFNLLGDSESEWSGGSTAVAIVCLPKENFPAKPGNHDQIVRADDETWTIDSVNGDDPISWTVKAFREYRPK